MLHPYSEIYVFSCFDVVIHELHWPRGRILTWVDCIIYGYLLAVKKIQQLQQLLRSFVDNTTHKNKWNLHKKKLCQKTRVFCVNVSHTSQVFFSTSFSCFAVQPVSLFWLWSNLPHKASPRYQNSVDSERLAWIIEQHQLQVFSEECSELV